jgi:hypothetical protein
MGVILFLVLAVLPALTLVWVVVAGICLARQMPGRAAFAAVLAVAPLVFLFGDPVFAIVGLSRGTTNGTSGLGTFLLFNLALLAVLRRFVTRPSVKAGLSWPPGTRIQSAVVRAPVVLLALFVPATMLYLEHPFYGTFVGLSIAASGLLIFGWCHYALRYGYFPFALGRGTPREGEPQQFCRIFGVLALLGAFNVCLGVGLLIRDVAR